MLRVFCLTKINIATMLAKTIRHTLITVFSCPQRSDLTINHLRFLLNCPSSTETMLNLCEVLGTTTNINRWGNGGSFFYFEEGRWLFTVILLNVYFLLIKSSHMDRPKRSGCWGAPSQRADPTPEIKGI